MDLDDDIRAVEQRIARGRHRLAALAEDCEETARHAIVSPHGLIAVAAVGFMLGEMLRPRRRPAPTRNAGLGGLVGGAIAALLRARYGNPWSLAALTWARAAAARNAQREFAEGGGRSDANQQPSTASARASAR